MKQIFTFLAVALLSINAIHAQIKITRESHGFRPGDEHACQAVEYRAPGESGTNVVWDFRELVSKENIGISSIETFSGVGYNTVVERNDGITFRYNITNDQVEYFGYEKENRQYSFTTPIVKTKYPQFYGTFFEGTFAGKIIVKGESAGEIAGTYSTNVDAEGTILLPDGEKLPVIRVKTTKVTTQWGPACNSMEVIKYLWYAQDIRYPVFVTMETAYYNTNGGERMALEKSSYLNTNLKRESKLRTTTGLDGIDANFTCKISPNPFKEQLNVQYSLSKQSSVSIELFNSQGAKVAVILPKQIQEGDQVINYNAGNTVSVKGVYFLRFMIDGKVHIEKLIKN
ncbi:hypothetical protein FACS1894155_04380 [Bacteroidia bacterium]|nr:hypothetical protein FACS1894155_04380 [Bacteroidia bacterium]